MFPSVDNDLDGEALAAAIGQGPESLKEAIPSLSKRLKLIGAIQVLMASLASEDTSSHKVLLITEYPTIIYRYRLIQHGQWHMN